MKKINYKICNIVSTGELGFDINLNILALKLENSEYEPQQFSGLIYKLINPKATFLIFGNGKFVCTGLKNEKDIEDALLQLQNHIQT